MRRRGANALLWVWGGAVGLCALAGCANLLGLDEFVDAAAGGAGGATSAATGTGGATSTGATSGTGGAGGTGGGMACSPGSTTACYTGPTGTEGVGLCAAGLATCEADGSGYGPCEGEVLPATDSCATAEDEDCTGAANEGCPCAPGDVMACYGGPAGTEGVGLCVGGQQTCEADGSGYGPCIGEVGPAGADDCNALGDEDCDGYACSEPIWAQSFATSGSVVFPVVAGDPTGNIYLLAVFTGSLTLGAVTLISAGSGDLVLAKFDHAGVPIWSKQFGDASPQTAASLAVDAAGNVLIAFGLQGAFSVGGGVLTSAGSTDLAVAKFDGSGSLVWSTRFGDASNQLPGLPGGSIVADANGDVLVTGRFAGTLALGAGGTLVSQGGDDVFLTKLSGATGAAQWGKRFGDASNQSGRAIAVDSAGNPTIIGSFDGTVNLGANTLTASATDIFVARFDGAGNNSCAYSIDTASSTAADSIAVDAQGSAIISGSFGGSATMAAGPSISASANADIFLGKSTSACVPVWLKSFGGVGADLEAKIDVDAAGRIFLVTRTSSPSIDFGGGPLAIQGTYNIALASFDGGGVHRWSRIFQAPGAQLGPSISEVNGLGVLLSATDTSGLDLGTGLLADGLPLGLFAP